MGVNTGATINGRYHSWASIRFNFLGRSVSEVTEIEYSEEDEINEVKAVGNKAIGYTQDNTTTAGSITLLSSAVEKITRALPKGKRIQDIKPFPITVSYIDDDGLLVTHILKGVKIKKNLRSGKSGSSDALTVQSPLYIHDIDWQG